MRLHEAVAGTPRLGNRIRRGIDLDHVARDPACHHQETIIRRWADRVSNGISRRQLDARLESFYEARLFAVGEVENGNVAVIGEGVVKRIFLRDIELAVHHRQIGGGAEHATAIDLIGMVENLFCRSRHCIDQPHAGRDDVIGA